MPLKKSSKIEVSYSSKFQLMPAGLAGLWVSLILGIGFTIATFGLPFILGVSSYWQTEVDDVTQYIAGFNMYFAAPWQYPLLAFNSLNYPQGTSATFVDAIPLYALVLKLVLPASLAPFNPYGVWVALCFTLQAVSAWWISRELQVHSWAFLISLVVLFLVSPALMARIGHISLMSHWIILFALTLYIRSRRLESLQTMAWVVLLVPAFYVNIYLFAMASGIYLATLLSIDIIRDRRTLVAFALPFVGLIATLFVTLLPLPTGEVTREGGFGYYSMNLLAPVLGGSLFQVHARDALGQYEGFNYLGLGVLFAFVAALQVCHRQNWIFFRRHWSLFALLMGYTVYALSSEIYFGTIQILTIEYPKFLDVITSQFRASGRFFWPVGYALVIFALLVLYRHLRLSVFVATSLLLVLLQLGDLKERYTVLKTTVARQSVPRMDYPVWDKTLGERVRTLYFYPKFKCGAQSPHESLLPTMKYAAERGYNLTTGYIARYTPRCDGIGEEIAASSGDTSAYIFVKKEYESSEKINSLLPIDIALQCREVDFAFVCSKPY